MATSVHCPQCQASFIVKDHLKYRVRFDPSFLKLALRNIVFPWLDGLEEVYKPHIVVCPKCGNEFVSKGYKYFGFIEAKHFQIGLFVALLLFIFIYFVGLIWSAIRATK